MGVIRQMDESLAKKIRAGEVVDGPHSVVKELVDNAIDAGAVSVEVSVEHGGLRLIRVADDGCGMDPEDAQLCLLRHATSKIRTEEDLLKIGTKGFRGEALAVILSFSTLQIDTRTAENEAGTSVRAADGRIQSVETIARTPGTTVQVKQLFQNTPARLKYAASPRAEEGRVMKAVLNAALAHPEVRFRFVADGQEKLNCAPANNRLHRIQQIYGEEFAKGLIEVRAERGKVVVEGYVSRPQDAVRSSRRTNLFVNTRPVKSHVLKRVLSNAFGDALPRGMNAEALIWVSLPAEELDVNVSPDKSEVKFLKDGQVWAACMDAFTGALADARATVTLGSHGNQRTPHEFSHVPLQRHGTVEHPPATMPEAELVSGAGLFDAVEAPVAADTPQPGGETRRDPVSGSPGAPEGERKHGLPENPGFLLQVDATYLLCPVSGGVLYIDQHSAHERINYERLKASFMERGRQVEIQPLLFPESMRLDPEAASLLEEMDFFLRRLGFEVDPAGPHGEFWIQCVPSALGDRSAIKAIQALMDEYRRVSALGLREEAAAEGLTRAEDRMLMTIACHAAIKSGQLLNQEEIQALWRDLIRVDLACHDVHGRAGVVFVPSDEIDRRMGRSSRSGF